MSATVLQSLHNYLSTQQWQDRFSESESQGLKTLCEAPDFDLTQQADYWCQLLTRWDHRNLDPHRSVHSEVLAILNTYIMALHQERHYPLEQLEPLRWKLAEIQVDLQQKILSFWRFEYDQAQERLQQINRENERAKAEFYTLTELADFLSSHIDDIEQLIYHSLDALYGVMGAQQILLCFEPEGTSNYAPYLFEAGQLIQVSRQDLSEHPLWKRCWESPVHQVRAHYCDANAPLPCFDDVTEVMLWQTLALASDKKVLLIASARDPYTFNGFHTWFTLAGVHLAGALNNAQLNSQLNEMVIRDGLMGIYNRRYLEQRLQEAFKVSERYQRPLSVLMVDIDHFKQVNDTYGHPVGDEVLKWVSRSIGQRLRTTDILGRYGGEEFLIILPETDLKGASKLAQSLVQRIEQLPVEQIVGGLHITISIGVCSYPQQATRAEDLVQIADQHLYQAKRQGRNQYTAGEGA